MDYCIEDIKNIFNINNNPIKPNTFYYIKTIENKILTKELIDLFYKNNCVKWFSYTNDKLFHLNNENKYLVNGHGCYYPKPIILNDYIIFNSMGIVDLVKKSMIKNLLKDIYNLDKIQNKNFVIININYSCDINYIKLFYYNVIKILLKKVSHIYIDGFFYEKFIDIDTNKTINEFIKKFSRYNNFFYFSFFISNMQDKKNSNISITNYYYDKINIYDGKIIKKILYNELLYMFIRNIIVL